MGIAWLLAPGDAAAVPQWNNTSSRCAAGPVCDSTECKIDCSTGAEYVIFGHVTDNNVDKGYGICVFTGGWPGYGGYYDGYLTRQETDTALWTVRLDGDGASGGNDYLQLAETGGETCAGNVTIRGELPSNDDYLFWGDLGTDHIWMCDNVSTDTPASSECLPDGNDGRADGRGGSSDRIVGTYWSDEIWGDAVYGGNGDDTITGSSDGDYLYGWYGDDTIYGEGGADVIGGDAGQDELHGGSGTDTIDGGSGNDTIHGDNHADDIWGGLGDDFLYGDDYSDEIHGEDGCDTIDGGFGSDTCWCDEDTTSNEPITSCDTPYYCIDAATCFG